MRAVGSEALGDLQLARLHSMPDVGQVGRTSNDLRHQRRHLLLTKHELLQGLRNRVPGRELTNQIHPPRRVANVPLVTNVLPKLIHPALDDEGPHLLVSIGVRKRGEVFGGVHGD